MSDQFDAPVLGVIASMEILEAAVLSIVEVRPLVVRGRAVTVYRVRGDGGDLWALSRSQGRRVFAHAIDYRSNVDALESVGVTSVISTAMVGSLRPAIAPGALLLVDQFLDFTTLTPHTYFEDETFRDFDFSYPYDEALRSALVEASLACGVALTSTQACYVGSDGPRFETAAEVRAFAALGGDVVGMTGVAECILAREKGMRFATIAGVVNLGAGLSPRPITAEALLTLRGELSLSMARVISAMPAALSQPEPRMDVVAHA